MFLFEEKCLCHSPLPSLLPFTTSDTLIIFKHSLFYFHLQIVANRTMTTPLRELKSLVRQRTTETRDTVGFNIAAMKIIARIANERKNERIDYGEKSMKDIWAGMGLGSDIRGRNEHKKGNK